MNTVVVRRSGNVAARRRRRRRTGGNAPRAGPVVVVQTPRAQPGRRRRRRNRNARRRGGSSRGTGSLEKFVFSKDGLVGSSKGSLIFGPSLSECPAFSAGILKAYHEYKITSVLLEFISEAASTTSGSVSYELDPHGKLSELSSTVNRFKITQNGRRVWGAQQIRGNEWHDASEDQFKIHFKGNSTERSSIGGFRVTIQVATQSPK
ncbi:TPA_asm: P3 protein [Piper methysticum polerovirus]|nr:TPA_asm: P3 protein [Piper methysticum polerovirus]